AAAEPRVAVRDDERHEAPRALLLPPVRAPEEEVDHRRELPLRHRGPRRRLRLLLLDRRRRRRARLRGRIRPVLPGRFALRGRGAGDGEHDEGDREKEAQERWRIMANGRSEVENEAEGVLDLVKQVRPDATHSIAEPVAIRRDDLLRARDTGAWQ